MKKGKVFLVGAGPGDPGLLTVRAAEVISRAQVILYDALVGPSLTQFAPSGAKLVPRGKWNGSSGQELIEKFLIREARKGLEIVHLKGGDPFVFGRGAEEAEALRKAGIPFEIVPGVSSAIAVPAYAGVPVTHRSFNSSFTVVTGHEDPTKPSPRLDWDHLAANDGTLVFLMGLKTLPRVCESLMQAGKSPRTPAILIEKGTTARQRNVQGTLSEMPALARKHKVCPPAILVVGKVVTLRSKMEWRQTRPLSDVRVVTTRELPDRELITRLREEGAEVVSVPCVELKALSGGGAAFLRDPESYDWVVLSSQRGAAWFVERLTASGKDARDLAGVKIACVGPSTSAELVKRGLRPDLIPKMLSQEGLVRAFRKVDLRGKRVLLARAKESRDVLDKDLRARGAQVETWDLYETLLPRDSKRKALDLFDRQGGADLVVFASSLAAKNFYGFLTASQKRKWLKKLAVASIGPVTSKTVRELGFKVAVEPKTSTLPALVEGVKRWAKKRKKH